ncbi:MAG: LytTR family DNA-binding domain-containing protein [Clostridia bacterium]|nr:LytTR family DNA-binding domain-containing protein [Clostridia bacterium]
MKIAVIDDERPARKELVHQIMEAMPDSQIEEADSGASAIELISRQTFDLLFVDISLGDMEGTTLAAAVRRILPDAQIVFATAYSQYGVRAFELGINNYILKPFDPDRVRRVLEKCQKDLEKNQAPADFAVRSCDGPHPGSEAYRPSSCAAAQDPGDSVTAAFPSSRMPINMNRTIILVDIQQIVYIETSGRSCIIHTTTRDYTENLLLGEYEKRLASHGFCRIHKSYLVNLNFITELFPWANNSLAVKMQGFEKNILPVSREKSKMLRQLIGV